MPTPICRRRVLAIIAATSLFAAACSDDADTSNAATTTEPPAADTTTEAEAATTTTTTMEPADTPEEPTSEPPTDPFVAITETVSTFVLDAGLEGAGLVIVERDAGIVYEEYFGAFDADRTSLIASASKMISAGVLLRLAEDGLLDIDAPIEQQVDWAVGNPEMTPAQLVSNSSGLVGLGPNLLYAPYLCQWAVENTLTECGEAVFTTADDDADQRPPDSEFRYGGAQWQVAGAVAETVSGKTWEQLIDEIYVQPCGVDSLGYISLGAVLTGGAGYPTVFAGDPDGVTPSENPNIEGGAYITASDYGTLLLMHIRGGECTGDQVLSQASLDTMHADRIAAIYGGDAGGADTGYGMGWWVDRETGRISDGGAWGAAPWLDLDDGYGAYIIVEDDSSTGQELKSEIEELVHAAVTDA